MERLTFEGNFCDIAQCRELPCKYDGNCTQKEVWERLKAYEDSRLSPQACAEAREIEETLSGCGYSISRMVDLMKADKDGRVVILPCRQGDELWTYCNHPVKRVYSFTVSDVSTLNGRTVLNTLGLGTISPEDIGKTVFLTREEAEKSLQEMEGEA
jgi:hypothetical protein|nr:MAG TPA: hypothetical protein [Caudoviricetes sp.]